MNRNRKFIVLYFMIFLLSETSLYGSVIFKTHFQGKTIDFTQEKKDSLDFHYTNLTIREIFFSDSLSIELGDTQLYCYKVDRRKSSSSTGLFFIVKKRGQYELVKRVIDPWSWQLQIFGVDFNHDNLKEIVTVWSDESIFYVKIYQWKFKDGGYIPKEIFSSQSLGNSETRDKHLLINGDRIILYYQSETGEEKRKMIYYDERHKIFHSMIIDQ